MKNKNGSLMIEVIVALFLVIIGILGIVNLLTKSFYFNFETYNRLIAVNLAIEGIEVVKNIIDLNIATSSYNWSKISPGIYEVNYACFSLPCSNGNSWNLNNIQINENFFRSYVNYLKFDENYKKFNYLQNGNPLNFKRVVRVETNANEGFIKVNSYVFWSYKGRSYLINLEDNFYNWR